MRLSRFVRTSLLFVLIALSSCADYCAQSAFTNVVHERTAVFVHSAPPDAIWRETARILAEQGVVFPRDEPPVAGELVSDWKGKPGNRLRFAVRISEAGPANRLVVNRTDEREVGIYPDTGVTPDPAAPPPEPIGHRIETTVTRDLDVEWRVLERLAPKDADEIRAAAAKRAEEVRDVVASGCR